MHTAICTFEDRALAQQAVDRLLQAGFGREDVHLEMRHPDGSPVGEAGDGQHDVVAKFNFFESLFGQQDSAGHASRYAQASERGLCVVMVESLDESEAEHAQNILHGMEARDVSRVHRQGERPLRDVLGERQRAPERAMASQGWGEQRTLELVDDDRPIASPDIAAAHQREDKPR